MDQLVVFTRYPTPGKTKTRLIPALGAEGAARLQQQMTEHMLVQVKALAASYPLKAKIWFASDRALAETQQQLMQSWLGDDLDYQPQVEGDLGARMAHAFQGGFASGSDRIITIGTDCPGLDTVKLAQAFEQLHQHDLVLGPATDGGYYLIGLRRFVPELFQGIVWGTAEVFSRTVEIASRLQLSAAFLEPLTDIDRPDDLPIWEQIATNAIQSR
ncbi:TIGR04282 family arsenosugar biosynthesis glycosyltransferase [Oculatella sp. LEGE 06141]|uniref:TIGR04282 family arsenosugar biosynthesis glycosyltransferase n=1 Tax=Oculatella sp. LEGE 06141 TaxID=1828648 RepID=UPI0018800602|nr:TIGR04282 family arsenosugar biosynthesis glycosyltransferase [Oculatella sp. LEGE 06141]MBE9180738.1 TIGR04282 family arsenosugar biosynthesis glycosyltransferase [Oculatella sp. LEGE 06141]